MNIPHACSRILGQLIQLVNRLSAEEYARSATVLGNHSLGQHIRHIIEFFTCLEQGMQRGCVNYDRRAHDKLLESDKYLALEVLHRIQNFVNNPPPNSNLLLELDYAVNPAEMQQVPTNFLRELVYNIEHAVHHMALIRLGVREVAPHITLPPDFGVAASTIRHQQKTLSAEA
jgi:uncharacterized damage-inducible protein DinB